MDMTNRPGQMRRGIHRGYASDEKRGLRRVWVSDGPGKAGEWLSEVEYRARGYLPSFDSLPVKIVQRTKAVQVRVDDLPQADREFVSQWMNKEDKR
jgi:hypothetical protein